MLEPSEKAYYRALRALENKQYQQAAGYFDQAAGFFDGNEEFDLLRDTTRLLVELKQALATAENVDEDALIIEEMFTDGKETNLP